MAKTRRIIRKQNTAGPHAFDDQLWPVLLALTVLTGFVMGVLTVYLRFDDPRWYANAMTWLIMAGIAMTATAVALVKIDNRKFRRSLQLAILLGLFIHAGLFVTSLELHIFDPIRDLFRPEGEPQRPLRVVTVPEYVEREQRERQRQQFERPIETESPEPQPELEPREREPDPEPEEPAPTEPQPTPVPEPEDTVRPKRIERPEPEETSPRFSEQQSLLSRRLSSARATPPATAATPVDVASPAAPAESRLSAQASDLQRLETPRPVERRLRIDEPSTERSATAAELARRQAEQSPRTLDPATPTFRRRIQQPTEVPRTEVDLADTPAVSEQTRPQELRPHTTLADKRETASPQRPRSLAEPTPQTTADARTRSQRRELRSEHRPILAETPVTVPNRRARATARPDVATAARPLTTTESRQSAATASELADRPDMDVRRVDTTAQANPAEVAPEETPPQTPSLAVRRDTARQPTPAVQPSAANHPPRQRTPAAIPVNPQVASAETPQAATTPVTAPRESIASRPTTASRSGSDSSPSTSATAAATMSDPAAPAATAAAAASAATRRPRGPDSPQVATAAESASQPRRSVQASPSLTTTAASTDTLQAAVRGRTDQPRPSLSEVARQTTAETAADRSQPLASVATASTATQVAAARTSRASSDAMPSVTPDSPTRSTATRTITRQSLTASPRPVESPAVAASTRGVASPEAAPARTAVTKAITGTAGVGQGRNLDRANPAGQTPANVASASARRAESLQNLASGPDLAPQEAALIPRSRAEAERPGAMFRAEPILEIASTSGAREPTTLTANASAALTRAQADAAEGPVSAAAGQADVDLGPTQIVSENRAGRASGGGQPQLNFETASTMLARSAAVGGVPDVSIAADAVSDTPTAPDLGGGMPLVAETELAPTSVARTDPGAQAPFSGGPTRVAQPGPPTEASLATQVAEVELARAERAEAAPGESQAGGGEPDEDEEERRRRLARAALAGTLGVETSTRAEPPVTEAVARREDDADPSPVTTAMARPEAGQSTPDPSPAPPGTGTQDPTSGEPEPVPTTSVATRSPEGPADAPRASDNSIDDAMTIATASGMAGRVRSRQPEFVTDPVAAMPAGRNAATTSLAAVEDDEPNDQAEFSGPLIDAPRKVAAVAPVRAARGRSSAEVEAAADSQLAQASHTRAEAVEGIAGEPDVGGGTGAPPRAAVGPTLATDIRADATSIAGASDSSGQQDGTLLAAQGVQAARVAQGRVAAPEDRPIGTENYSLTVDVAVVGEVGMNSGSRRTSPADSRGPVLAGRLDQGAPLPKTDRTHLPSGTASLGALTMPASGSLESSDIAEASDWSASDLPIDVARQTVDASLAVNLDAAEGPGGFADRLTEDLGLNVRRALPDSLQVALHSARFVRRDVGGAPDLSTSAMVAAEPYRRRMTDRDSGDSSEGAGAVPASTERAIQMGLAFLSRHQLPDGSWSLQGIEGERPALVSDTAATALAMLAFQGDGCTHRGQRYAEVMRAGIDYLVKNQKQNGDLFLPLEDDSNKAVWLYSHALAALALCEAYGMTQDPDLREPAQKALDFIVAAQHPTRGGWRYSPQDSSDTSVTGWMMMALKSGELANLDVPEAAYQKIGSWLNRAQASQNETHLYRYNPYAPDTDEQRHGRVPSKTMTAVGLLMRLYLGWHRENPQMIAGADYLAANLPAYGSSQRPQRDTYYWYYGTQVMFHMKGDYWRAWNNQLHPLLVESQIQNGDLAGSWDPRRPVPDRWAPHAGRFYVTTMNLLSLEVVYRHLPIYEETAR